MYELDSNAELTQMMVEMLVQHHAPAGARNASKNPTRWPGGGWPARRNALHEIPQPIHIRRPRGRTGREKLRWTLPFSSRPRHGVNREPIQGDRKSTRLNSSHSQ